MESLSMYRRVRAACGGVLLLSCIAWPAYAGAKLDLSGYADDSGAISIQYHGDTIDPYFALQALLLAQESGMDITPYAEKWADWLAQRQKPDGTFDRFCRNGPVWAPCKTADADDALLAMWLKFLDSMPQQLKSHPAWQKSYRSSAASLVRLLDPARGIYLVSPVYQHGLFMDNLEVLSYRPTSAAGVKFSDSGTLAGAIQKVFWDVKGQRYLVSTQPEQKKEATTFYPDAVAQIFPLLFDFKSLPGGAHAYYQHWMKEHRSDWLKQAHSDFAWGLVAAVAVRQNDVVSASCWLRETAQFKRSVHWTATDEVVSQLLAEKSVKAAAADVSCK
jgi:hypothetical protein